MIGGTSASIPRVAEFVSDLRRLCRGEALQSASTSMRLDFGHPERCPPIVVGSAGPRGLELAGELGDGVIVTGQVGRQTTLARQLDHVRAGRARAKVHRGEFAIHVAVAAAVHADRAMAFAAVKPLVASFILSSPGGLSELALDTRRRIKTQYQYDAHMRPGADYAREVPDAIVPDFAIAGTPRECIARCEALFDAGVDQIILSPYSIAGQTRREMIEAFSHDVMQPLQRMGSWTLK
jgi:5,10-methylenetetrahydromethanopterin reductase